jgi:hypothetical protein
LNDIGPAPGQGSFGDPSAISPNGIAAGMASAPTPDAAPRAVLWNPGQTNPTPLPPLATSPAGVTWTDALGVNNAGIAVGRSQQYVNGTFVGDRAVRWLPGQPAVELGHLGLDSSGKTTSRAQAINAGGNAVGWANRYDAAGADIGTRPVFWPAGQTAAIELQNFGPLPTNFVTGDPTAINDSGVIVGSLTVPNKPGGQSAAAVRWDSAQSAPTALDHLGVDGPSITVKALAVDAAGDAFGYSTKWGPLLAFKGIRPVRWDAGQTAATELGTLGVSSSSDSTQAFVFGANHQGDAVGEALDYIHSGGGEFHALLWPAGSTVPIDLNDLLPPDSGWLLTEANAISDDGVIVGRGTFDPDGPGPLSASQFQAFRMAPLPEPSLFGVGGVIALLLASRRRAIESRTWTSPTPPPTSPASPA